ncbi:MAG TPA: amidohydrolase family protein [Burkholderiales bacterium]|nr:amidohydrolase family protein [Burkholderiales bacterium]
MPPPGSTDAQIHIYGDISRYPLKQGARYVPPVASYTDAVRMHSLLGFSRRVLVQPTVYGTDHRLIIDTLSSLQDRDSVRATVILDLRTSDEELTVLQELGARGARLNISARFGMTPSKQELRRLLERIRELGWHARLHIVDRDVLNYGEVFLEFPDLVYVIDHLGHVNFAEGLQGPAFQWILRRLHEPNWWMMLSNGNRISAMDREWHDAVPFGRACVEVAPDRVVWGSDWPHVEWTKRMMNDAEVVELMYRYVDYDPALVRAILVDNPARLFGF